MFKADNSQKRKELLKELIKRYSVENQDELVDLLKKEYGIETTQSIVSRDLRELGAIKRKIKDSLVYELKDTDVTLEILRLGVLDIVHNESLVVIKTRGGFAAFIGDFLDQLQNSNILATLAGENVVFVVPPSKKNIEVFFETVCLLVHFKQPAPSQKVLGT